MICEADGIRGLLEELMSLLLGVFGVLLHLDLLDIKAHLLYEGGGYQTLETYTFCQ
jgi:hypothetical protein